MLPGTFRGVGIFCGLTNPPIYSKTSYAYKWCFRGRTVEDGFTELYLRFYVIFAVLCHIHKLKGPQVRVVY